MNFSDALAAAMTGSKISRESWVGMGGYLAFITVNKVMFGVNPATGEYDVPLGSRQEVLETLMRVTNAGAPSQYVLMSEDVSAVDWVAT